ncbi:MarR family winged helix-turn-helix transcriptional regulator [Loigolactobacillus binensis]|uniref:MarR family winged helix-turn-helix transcriptional regulator n=1 Tax=Loigolactobacillus binensis TaxID=2559922 RepID=A0ABW3E9W9_9LACO|nr:MarR family winged helix-turn-helix transcriptional regulator [Loigolactobacillus binensis]
MSEFTDELMKQLRFISQASNAFMRDNKQKLTGQQRVLAVLAHTDNLNQSYLAEILDLRPSSLAELLKKMELNGDIVRTEDANDKRIKQVALTEQGRQKAQKNAAQKTADASETFFNGLNETQQQEFADYLAKITAGWPEDFQHESRRFVDPLDRLQAMQDLHDAFTAQYGERQNLSAEEMKDLKAQMRRAMHEMPFMGHRGMPGFSGGPRGDRSHHHGFRRDPRAGFWDQRPDGEKPNEDDWKDF